MNILHTARVIKVILQRECIIIKKNVRDSIINAIVRVLSVYLGVGLLGYLIGFDVSIASDVLTGSMVSVYINRCFGISIGDSYDRQFSRYIDYKRLLPLSTRGLLLSYIFRYMMTVAVSAVPLIITARIVLGDQVQFAAIHWGWFVLVFLLSMLMISSFFTMIIFLGTFDWIRFNLWQRILTPAFAVGCLLYSWYKVYFFNPMIGRILLASPIVYLTEGVRSTLLAKGTYIPPWYCALGLAVWSCIWMAVVFGPMARRIKKGKV